MLNPSSNPMPLILLFTAIGFIVGAAITYFSTRGGSGAIKKELEQLRQRDRLMRELNGFSREKVTHKLVVWLGGKPFPTANQLTDAQRQQLQAEGRDFLAWLGSEQAAAQALVTPPPVAPPPAQSLVTPPPSVQAPAVQLPARPAFTPAPAAAQPVAPLPAEAAPIRTGQTGPLAGLPQTGPLAGLEEKKIEKPLSIVEQINDILQEMMRGTPLESKGVRLTEDPRKGVVVWVGLVPFAGVDAVTDPEIKDALRAAASEWERRTDRNRR